MLNKNKRGFTIVELLIVIVVIAILAAISVIAFNSIQDRSANTIIQNNTLRYYKALSAFKIDNGAYPTTAQSGNAYVCLNDYTASSETYCANFAGGVQQQTLFNEALKNYLGTTILEKSSEKYMYSNNYNNLWRGLFYQTSSGGQLRFVQYSVSACPQIAGLTPVTTGGNDAHKLCTLTLP